MMSVLLVSDAGADARTSSTARRHVSRHRRWKVVTSIRRSWSSGAGGRAGRGLVRPMSIILTTRMVREEVEILREL